MNEKFVEYAIFVKYTNFLEKRIKTERKTKEIPTKMHVCINYFFVQRNFAVFVQRNFAT